jgi:hypothetical protein
MSHGERAEKVNRRKGHDWHMARNGMTGKRRGNPAYDWRPRHEKVQTRRIERRVADRALRALESK